jgi:23S rRNA (pseudouridine1915-N3)-methyltransferase
MKIHIITIGEPKLAYARSGWAEYTKRLGRFHQLRVSHLDNKHAYDGSQILHAAGSAYKVILEIKAKQYTSQELAALLDKLAYEGREICFIIGGPDGLPQEVIDKADLQWSMSALTFPHDLAMVVLVETLYRSSSINTNHPYHRE